MTVLLTRRRVLCASATAVTTGYAGCTGILGSDDPDDGTDSYGLTVDNRTQKSHTVSIQVMTMNNNETVFEEVVQLESKDERSWDTVFDQDGQYQITSWFDSDERPKSCRALDANCGIDYVNIGDANAPSVTDFRIVIRYGSLPMKTETTTLLELRFSDE